MPMPRNADDPACPQGQELPFDIRSFRCIVYDDTIAGKPQVEAQLRKHLETITASPPDATSP